MRAANGSSDSRAASARTRPLPVTASRKSQSYSQREWLARFPAAETGPGRQEQYRGGDTAQRSPARRGRDDEAAEGEQDPERREDLAAAGDVPDRLAGERMDGKQRRGGPGDGTPPGAVASQQRRRRQGRPGDAVEQQHVAGVQENVGEMVRPRRQLSDRIVERERVVGERPRAEGEEADQRRQVADQRALRDRVGVVVDVPAQLGRYSVWPGRRGSRAAARARASRSAQWPAPLRAVRSATGVAAGRGLRRPRGDRRATHHVTPGAAFAGRARAVRPSAPAGGSSRGATRSPASSAARSSAGRGTRGRRAATVGS